METENSKLNSLLYLPTNEKLELTNAILDSVRKEFSETDIPEWHKEILEERLKKIENGEMKFVSWEKVKEMLQEKMMK